MFNFENLPLEERVKFFIQQRKETEYWDFKEEWLDKEKLIKIELAKLDADERNAGLTPGDKYKKAEVAAKQVIKSKTGDLIKDIICFSNTSHERDCYLIFGISDDYEIVGLGKTERLEQAKIENIIADMVFANGVRPEFDLDTINLEGKEIQVLTIRNEKRTPIYLEKPYGKMKVGCIYTRHGDRNTPDNGNAAPAEIESLWKKRFNLLKTSLDFVFDTLNKDDEWAEIEEDYFNVHYPAYNIKIRLESSEESDRGPMFYHYAMVNSHSLYGELSISYNQTLLYSYLVTWLDGGILGIPVPESGYLNSVFHESCYALYQYYVIGSKIYKLRDFLYDPTNNDQRSAMRRLQEVVLLYRSDNEKKSFEHWITGFPIRVREEVEKNKEHFFLNCPNEIEKNNNLHQLALGEALNSFLDQFRKLDNYQALLEDAEYLQ